MERSGRLELVQEDYMRYTSLVTAVVVGLLLGPIGVDAQAGAKLAAAGPSAKSSEPIKDTKRFAEHSGLFRSSAMVGSGVKDSAGKDAGKVEDLLIDAHGNVSYAVLSFGGFAGIGDKLFAVPWDALIVDRENRVVYLDVKRESLERRPSFTANKWPDASDKEWGREVHQAWADATITAAVKAKLAGVSAATLLKVGVDTSQGIVQLTGTVDSERTKQRASEVARQVGGVRKVVNNLKTTQG
jgi:osmotically-inducible protein OsmY